MLNKLAVDVWRNRRVSFAGINRYGNPRSAGLCTSRGGEKEGQEHRRPHFRAHDSLYLTMASAAFAASTHLLATSITYSLSNHRNPKSSMHSGKSGLMMMYPGITPPGMKVLSARLLP